MSSSSAAFKAGLSPASPGVAGGAKRHDDIFRTTAWRDIWAAVLYFIGLGAFVGLAFVNSKYLFQNLKDVRVDDGTQKLLMGLLVGVGPAALAAAAAASGFLYACYKAPELTIKFCYMSLVVIFAGFGVYSIVKGAVLGGIIFILMAGFDLFLFMIWRKWIPFTASLLRWTTRTLSEYPAMIFANFGTMVMSVLSFLTLFTSICGAFLMKHNAYRTDAWVKGTYYYSAFFCFWTFEVLSNVARVTTAGVFACRYFLGLHSPQAPNPTAESFKRATTYSFGSICFGSLIVAIISFLRFLLNSSNDRDSLAGAIVDCFLKVLEDLMRYFNTYAFTQVAIYGKPYIEAAKSTWDLVKRNGVDAIINDNLTGSVIGLGSLLVGVIGGLASLGAFYAYTGLDGAELFAAFLTGMLMAVLVSYSTLNVIGSGCTAFFVCLAEDPAALQRTDGEMYRDIASRYSYLNL